MADADLPQDRAEDRAEVVKLDSDDEEWVKVGLTRKEKYLKDSKVNNNGANPSDTGLPNYAQVTNGPANRVEEVREDEEATEAKEEEEEGDGQAEVVEGHLDDSDGISIISESDMEHREKNKSVESWCLRNNISGPLRIWEPQSNSPLTQSKINTLLVCFIGVLIGLAVNRIFSMASESHAISSSSDLNVIRNESDRLISHIKELTEVKSILNEIKATMPQRSELINEQETFEEAYFERSKGRQRVEMDDGSIGDGSPVLKQLRVTLNSLYGALSGVQNSDEGLRLKIRDTEDIISDLSALRGIMLGLAEEMDNLGRPMEVKFWQSANEKMIHISESLLSRLSSAVFRLTESVNSKLSKIRCNLNKRLCYLRNTLPEDEELLRKLDKDGKFLDACDAIAKVKCGNRENLDENKVKRTKDLKDAVNGAKRNFREKFEGTVRPSCNDFEKFLGDTPSPKDTCPVFSQPFTYAEVVAAKHLAKLKKAKKHYPAQKQPQVPQETKEKSAEDLTRNIETQKDLNDRFDGNFEAQSKRKKPKKDGSRTKRPTKEKRVKKGKGSTTDFVLLESIENVPEDHEAEKQKKHRESKKFDKKMRNRANETAENSADLKAKKRAKKYSSLEEEEVADWQFKRSHSREEQRLTEETSDDAMASSNWYFGWANNRRNSRANNCDNCDDDGGLEWQQKKEKKRSRKFRKNYEPAAKPHRKDILQTRHR